MKRFCRTLDKTVFFGTLSFQNTIQFVLCLKTHFEKIGNATSARVQNAHNIQNMYIYIYMIYIPVPSYVAQIWVREILGTFEDFSVRLMNFRAFCQFMRVCVFRCHIQPFPTRPTALSTTAAAAAAGSIEEARQCRVSQFFFSVSRAFCISSKHG